MTRSILPTVSSYPTNLARAIVVYEGDNDLARGYSSEQITATFLRFVDRVHRQLPESRIYFFYRLNLVLSDGNSGQKCKKQTA